MNEDFKIAITAVALFILITVGLMFGIPKYKVWSAEMMGRAEFSRAEQNRLIKIEEAKANLEAEKLNKHPIMIPTNIFGISAWN